MDLRGIAGALLLGACGLAAAPPRGGPVDLAGRPVDPFASMARVRVLLFVRVDCPITNRYAPELQRMAAEFAGRGVEFWLVYPGRSEAASSIRKQVAAYGFPGTPLRDPGHDLVRRARATIAPEAAVFDRAGALLYHGRIDDRYVEIGKARTAAQSHDLEDAVRAALAGRTAPRREAPAVGCSLADIE